MKRIIMVFISAAIISCDCFVHIQGVVIDSETRMPIEGVMVSRDDIEIDSLSLSQYSEGGLPNNAYGIDWDCGIHSRYTDSLGVFGFTYMTGYFLISPKLPLRFEKEGYNVFGSSAI